MAFKSVFAFVRGPSNGDQTSSSPTSPPPKPPKFLAFRSSTGFILAVVSLAIFTDILLYGLIVPVIPFSLTVQIGIPEDRVQHWTAILLACYNVTLCLGSPVAGLLADRMSSRRSPLLLGLLALAAATLLLCLGKTIALLVVGRLLQGLSAAIVWSVGLALLVDTVGKDIGYAMGYVSIAMSVGLLISPVIGGAVYEAAGYYAVYYVAFAVIACDIALRLFLIEKKVAQQWLPAPDMPAEAGQEMAEAGSDRARSNSNRDIADDSDPRPVDRPQKHPYMELVKSRRIQVVLLGVMLESGLVFACDTVLPLFVKDTFHWNSTAAGLVFVCLMVPGFGSPLVGKLADRYGAKWPSVAGFLFSIPSLVCLHLVTDNTLNQKILLCALLALLGVTLFALANTPLMAEMTYAIDAKEARRPGVWGEKGVYGIAYGLWVTAYALGGVVGSLMAGYVNAGAGWKTLTWSLAIWSAAGAVVSFGLGPRPSKRSP